MDRRLSFFAAATTSGIPAGSPLGRLLCQLLLQGLRIPFAALLDSQAVVLGAPLLGTPRLGSLPVAISLIAACTSTSRSKERNQGKARGTHESFRDPSSKFKRASEQASKTFKKARSNLEAKSDQKKKSRSKDRGGIIETERCEQINARRSTHKNKKKKKNPQKRRRDRRI